MSSKKNEGLIISIIIGVIIMALISTFSILYIKNALEKANDPEKFANSTIGKGVEACKETCEFYIAYRKTNNSEIARCYCRPTENQPEEIYVNITSGEILIWRLLKLAN